MHFRKVRASHIDDIDDIDDGVCAEWEGMRQWYAVLLGELPLRGLLLGQLWGGLRRFRRLL